MVNKKVNKISRKNMPKKVMRLFSLSLLFAATPQFFSLNLKKMKYRPLFCVKEQIQALCI